MLDRIDLVPWDSRPQPEWNRPGAVAAAVRGLAFAADDTSAWDAYNRLLFATGNNHAGTYYPVVLDVVPFLGEILEHGQLDARLRSLDALVDLVGSFCPEPGYEKVALPDGSVTPLDRELKSSVRRVWVQVAPVVCSRATDPRELELAQQLVALLKQDE